MTDLNGEGEVAAGIVVMRFGENALEVIRNVKAKLEIAEGRASRRASRSSTSTTARG